MFFFSVFYKKKFFLVNIIGLGSIGICMRSLQRGSEAQRTLLVVEGTPLCERAGERWQVYAKKQKKKKKKEATRNCTHSPLALSLPLPPPPSHLCSRRVRVLRLHGGRDLRALPGRLPRQRFDWHSRRLSALPLPGPEQLCSNCRDGTGGVHQLPARTDR